MALNRRHFSLGLLVSVALFGCQQQATGEDIDSASSPIVGGADATTDQIYSTVAINLNMSICTGSLIAPQVILTAAHCVADDAGALNMMPTDVTIVAGALSADNAPMEMTYSVKKIVSHEMYRGTANIPAPDANGLSKAYDIAILLLDNPVTTVPVVPIMPLAMVDSDLKDGSPLIITGYGTNDVNGMMGAGTLRIAMTPYKARNETEYFAGGAGQADTCQGDSGGPQYFEANGVRYQVGATSRGGGATSCGDGGIYTLAGAYTGWIATNSEGLFTESMSSGAGGSTSATTGSGGTTTGATTGSGGGAPAKSGGCSVSQGSSNDAFAAFGLLGLALAAARRRRAA